LRGVAFCAEARPAVESVIRVADSNVMARRIWFLPLSAIQHEADLRLVLCRDSIVTTGRGPERGHRSVFPRRVFARGVAITLPLSERGRRKSRAPTAPAAPCAKNGNNAHGFDRYSRDIPAFPAQWFYGLFRALPGEAAFLAPVVSEKLSPT